MTLWLQGVERTNPQEVIDWLLAHVDIVVCLLDSQAKPSDELMALLSRRLASRALYFCQTFCILRRFVAPRPEVSAFYFRIPVHWRSPSFRAGFPEKWNDPPAGCCCPKSQWGHGI